MSCSVDALCLTDKNEPDEECSSSGSFFIDFVVSIDYFSAA